MKKKRFTIVDAMNILCMVLLSAGTIIASCAATIAVFEAIKYIKG